MRTAIVLSALALVGSSAAAQTVNFGDLGISENFNSMGTSGTSAPNGWKHFTAGFGNNTTWTTSILTSGSNSLASIPVSSPATTLTAITTPSTTNNNGFNAARTTGNTADRALATSPTTVAGSIIQVAMVNTRAAGIASGSAFTLAYDVIRYRTVSSPNELPGYNAFISLNGTSWTQIGSLMTNAEVPNTLGIATRTLNFNLPGVWNVGATAYVRFVDDNADQTSPDQIVGLDNVSLIPAPGSVALMGLGVLVAGRRRR